MIKSMTGFGRSFLTVAHAVFTVEVKSLNAKALDLDLRLPDAFSDKEIALRHQIADILQRGKIAVYVTQGIPAEKARRSYDEAVFLEQYALLKRLADRVVASYDGIFSAALHAARTGVAAPPAHEANIAVWPQLERQIMAAVAECDASREHEGAVLRKKLQSYTLALEDHLRRLEVMDPLRRQKIEQGIRERLAASVKPADPGSSTRLEQEVLLYLERTAIEEECVRLGAHIALLKETLHAPPSSGKKMQFTVQEMMRELNTIGAKANDVEMSQCVIAMKEEVEKIKEQLGNVL